MLKKRLLLAALMLLGGYNLSIYTMEQSAALLDLKAQLETTVIACDIEQFQAIWQQYQEMNQAEDIATMQVALSEQVTGLRTQKIQVRTARVRSNSIAGLSAALASILFSIWTIYNCHG